MAALENNSTVNNKDLPREVLEAVIANTTDAVLALDPTGRILVLNTEAEKVYGTTQHEAVGLLFAEICILEQHLDPANDLVLKTVHKPNELLDEDIAIQFPSGHKKYFNIRTRLLLSTDNNKRLGLIVVLSDVTQRIEATRERAESGMFLATIVIALLIAQSVNGFVLKAYPSINIYSDAFVWIYTAITFIPILAYIIWMKKPLKEFGVTKRNWKKSLLEGTAISVIFLGLGALALIILGAIQDKNLSNYIQPDWLNWGTISYIPHATIQEFVFRGVLLTALIHMYRDTSVWYPLLLNALLFGFMHIQFGLMAVVGTFMIGFLFSWMYERHRNIIGISIAHIILGTSAFLFGLL